VKVDLTRGARKRLQTRLIRYEHSDSVHASSTEITRPNGAPMSEFALFLLSLFSIVNPFSAIPVFAGLTVGMPTRERSKITRQSGFAVFVILTMSYLTGQGLLRFFSISVDSLRVAGGLLILGMAWAMLQAKTSATKQTPEEAEEAMDRESIGVVPIAMPLLAGPGSISLMIIAAGDTDGFWNHALVLLSAFLVALSAWLILQAAGPIARALGKTGMNIATRLMGLILAAMAIEFITSGLGEIFPAWKGV
jgi:multiple antibiotic resistance protein